MKRSAFCFCLAVASAPAFAQAEQPGPIVPKPVAAQKVPDSAALAARDAYIDQQINMGLDVLYVTAGALMVGLGKNDSVRGAGAGVMLQGNFLFTFDGAMGFGAK